MREQTARRGPEDPIMARERKRKVGVVLSGSLQYRSEYRSTFSHRRGESSSTFTRGIPTRRIESPMQWSRKTRRPVPYRTWSFGKKPKGSARIRDRQPASRASNNVVRAHASSPVEYNAHHCTRPSPSFPSTREIRVHYIVSRHAGSQEYI